MLFRAAKREAGAASPLREPRDMDCDVDNSAGVGRGDVATHVHHAFRGIRASARAARPRFRAIRGIAEGMPLSAAHVTGYRPDQRGHRAVPERRDAEGEVPAARLDDPDGGTGDRSRYAMEAPLLARPLSESVTRPDARHGCRRTSKPCLAPHVGHIVNSAPKLPAGTEAAAAESGARIGISRIVIRSCGFTSCSTGL